ncbi:hypothetical protein [Methylobacillus flagellatus]|uniref:hypothetical protein n=1 Tax=Methylobacillus flagellatus TaxID=405 RepID=UPI0010F63ABC|nr:hypothetical protein [Methylobacillus flagellatus]
MLQRYYHFRVGGLPFQALNVFNGMAESCWLKQPESGAGGVGKIRSNVGVFALALIASDGGIKINNIMKKKDI